MPNPAVSLSLTRSVIYLIGAPIEDLLKLPIVPILLSRRSVIYESLTGNGIAMKMLRVANRCYAQFGG